MGATRQEDDLLPPPTPEKPSFLVASFRLLLPTDISVFHFSKDDDNRVITRAINQLKTTKVTTLLESRVAHNIARSIVVLVSSVWSTFQDFTTTMEPKLRLSGWRTRFIPNDRVFPLFLQAVSSSYRAMRVLPLRN